MALRLDSELMAVLEPMINQPKPVFEDALDIRTVSSIGVAMTYGKIPFPDGVEETNFTVKSPDGTAVPVSCFVPPFAKNSAGPHRAVIYIFGGGLVSGSVKQFRSAIATEAVGSGSQYFGVDYRLAPEHPFPAALEDLYATVQYLQGHAEEFNIDPARIVLHGVSAGAGLAAAVALMARDKGLSPPLAGQVLKYPMLDDQTTIPEDSPLSKHLIWTGNANGICWKAYLGGMEKAERKNKSISSYASPSRATNVSGLPRTFIEVGGLDLFRDEVVRYAGRLAAVKVDTEFHLYPGLVHGYDGMAPDIKASKKAQGNIHGFISSI